MHNLHARPSSRQPPANLHQTARITRHDRLNTRALDRVNLLIENRDGYFGILHGERPAKSATSVGVLELDELSSAHVADQRAWLALQVEIAQAVTRVVPGQLSVPARANVVDLEHTDEERTQLISSICNCLCPRKPIPIVDEQFR